MGEAKVVKSGTLQLQVKSFMRTNWVEKYCILFGGSTNNHPYLEFYDSKDAYLSCKKNGKKCEKTVDLQHLKAVRHSSQTTTQGQENHIEIHTKRSKHFIMVKNEGESRDWSVKLNTFVNTTDGETSSSGNAPDPDYPDSDDDDECDLSTVNMMYDSSDSATRFEVEVKHGDLATLCEIVGKKTLLVGQSELAFEDPVTRKIIYTFSYNWMRRYGKISKDRFNFECGRKCPNGPGTVDMITTANKDIHDLISKQAENTSTTKTPPAPDWLAQREQPSSEPQPVDRSGIGGPSMVTNIGRRHPGKQNVPSLVPIVQNPDRNSTPTTPTRLEVNLRDSREADREGDNVSNKFKQELENKLHDDGSKKISAKNSKKSKDDKKEKEKSEKEKKEKELEKEKERKELEKKGKEKEEEKSKEKKSVFGGIFSSKKEKTKEKEKEKEKGSVKAEKVPEANSKFHTDMYEEPDLIPRPKNPGPIGEALYDVADVRVEPPQDYSEGTYDEAISVRRDPTPVSSEPVVYAQPSIKSPASTAVAVYSDVRDVEKSKNAWKQYARKEDEEHHIEHYESIKSSRENLPKPAPPVPQRQYDVDEEDDTYDRTNNIAFRKPAKNTENLYGTASGPVGNVLPVPTANKGSDSEEEEEEDLYDNPDVEGYETAGNQVGRPVVQAYEDADQVIPWKPKPPKANAGKEQLYEEIG